jgi:hypothetical protein
MYAVKALGVLRVSEEGEYEGIDFHEHGISAYPEYALHPSATPQGAPAFASAAFHAAAAGLDALSPAKTLISKRSNG